MTVGASSKGNIPKSTEKEVNTKNERNFNIWNLDSLQEEDVKDSVSSTRSDESDEEKLSCSDVTAIMPLNQTVNQTEHQPTALPQYIDPSLLTDYTFPIKSFITENSTMDATAVETTQSCPDNVDMSETGATTTEDESLNHNEPKSDGRSVPTSFFGASASSLLQNAKASIPESLFTRPSFFDDDDSDDDDRTDDAFRKNDPIYLRVEQNKINPPPRSTQNLNSMFQSGEYMTAEDE